MNENGNKLSDEADLAVIDDKNAKDILIDLTEFKTYKEQHALRSQTMFLDNWYKFSSLVIFIIDLDLGRNHKDGIEIIKKIRQKTVDLPIIVYSANLRDKDIRNSCIESGANYTVQIHGHTKDEAKTINNHISEYFNKNFQILNYLKMQNENISKKFYDCKVVNINNDEVLLRIQDEKGIQIQRKFDTKRIDCSSNLQVTQCYKMVDIIHKCGQSSLEFYQLSEDPFKIDERELKGNLAHMLYKINKSK